MEATPSKLGEGSASLVERYASVIAGQLGCWDRIIITGTLPDVCHPAALERQLHQAGIRCFDLADFALPLRERIRDHAARLAADAGLQIELIERRHFRKEERIAEILARCGSHPGLVHVFSAMEHCTPFRPWHQKATGRTGVKATGGKCLHDYFYCLHERLGLIYVRVPTWLPFRLQVYFNGHGWRAGQLRAASVAFRLEDHALVEIADWARAGDRGGVFDCGPTKGPGCAGAAVRAGAGAVWQRLSLESDAGGIRSRHGV